MAELESEFVSRVEEQETGQTDAREQVATLETQLAERSDELDLSGRTLSNKLAVCSSKRSKRATMTLRTLDPTQIYAD